MRVILVEFESDYGGRVIAVMKNMEAARKRVREEKRRMKEFSRENEGVLDDAEEPRIMGSYLVED